MSIKENKEIKAQKDKLIITDYFQKLQPDNTEYKKKVKNIFKMIFILKYIRKINLHSFYNYVEQKGLKY